MTALKTVLIVFTFLLFALPTLSLSEEPPEGQLYWITEEYPDHYFFYDETAQHTGAVAAIDYACTQYSGSNGDYTGTVDMYYTSEDTEKAGWCVNKHPLYPGNVNGEYYTAYLYCNGVKRLLDDMSSCESPEPQIVDENNFGTPCEE
ncbi:hypothetical protein [Candidatus Electrothrix sp.]|uniref:hypothetical protein n=1 Tax=Candidatus Electrothrix sp. TaxID=2170559 RepID=UPI004056B12C